MEWKKHTSRKKGRKEGTWRERGGKMKGRDYIPQYYGLGKGKERNGNFEGNEPSSIWEL